MTRNKEATMAVYPLHVNSSELSVQSDDPDKPLLYVLRDLGLTGTKFGCGLGQCGACTVLVDGQSVRSCLTAISDAKGKTVTTIEGLGTPDKPSVLQAAFINESVPQCGYCTSGMIMTSAALLARTPRPTEAQVRDELDGNLCRCGSHDRVVRAVLRAAAQGG
jgi:nicotinate dehydrogenase subunit A